LDARCALRVYGFSGFGLQSALLPCREEKWPFVDQSFSQMTVWPEQAVVITAGADGWGRVILRAFILLMWCRGWSINADQMREGQVLVAPVYRIESFHIYSVKSEHREAATVAAGC
jgi:hypothetical protein